jgi:hypothetical protein
MHLGTKEKETLHCYETLTLSGGKRGGEAIVAPFPIYVFPIRHRDTAQKSSIKLDLFV